MRFLLMSALGALAACAADASPQASFAEPAPALAPAPAETLTAVGRMSCDVVATATAHGVELRAFAASPDGAAGEYDFTITKNDRGGSSDIVQGGAFALRPGERASLGSAEISIERGGSYHARLVITDADSLACEAERST